MRRLLSATCLLLIAMAAVSYAILSRPEPPNNLAIESIGTPGITLPGEITLLAPAQTDSVVLASFMGTAEAAPALPSAIEITGDTTPSFPAAPTGLAVGITGDIGDPVVALTSPEAGFVGGSVTWAATCTDDDTVESVQLVANNTPVCDPDIVSTYGGTCDLETELTLTEDTAVTLKARCCDTAANCADSDPVAVTVDITPPVALLLSPQAGYVAGSNVILEAENEDGIGSGLASAQFQVGGANHGSAITTQPFSSSLDVSAEDDGTALSITVEVADAVGNADESGAVAIIVDNTAPHTVAITSPAAGPAGAPGDIISIVSTASDVTSGVSSVECLVNTVSIGSATPTGTANEYACTWNTVGLSPATYSLTTRATDMAGNPTTSSIVSVSLAAPAGVTDGLVAYWPMDEGTGTSVADVHGGFDGAFGNTPVWVTGHIGAFALEFESLDHISVPDNSALDAETKDFSITFWVNTSSSGANQWVVEKGATSETAQGYSIYLTSTGVVTTRLGNGTSRLVIATSTSGVNNGSWRHVAVVFDRDANLIVYIDNNKETLSSISTHAGDINTSGNFFIGRTGTGGVLGQVDDLRFYNKVLSDTEVAAIYAYDGTGGTPPDIETGLVALLDFDENADTTASDSSGLGNHGTLTDANHPNAPAWVAGHINSALDFEADNNNVVNIGASSSINDLASTAMTVCAWVNPESLGGSSFGRIATQSQVTTPWRFNVSAAGDGTSIEFAVGHETTDLLVGSSALDMATMQHLCATYDGTSTAAGARIYKNGLETTYHTTTDGVGAKLSETSADVTIGNRDSTVHRSFDGIIDQFRLYNRVLSPEDIASLHAQEEEGTAPPPPSANAYYVSKSGSNSNACALSDGTEDATKAKLTITAGMTCLTSSGSTLIVKAGTYAENLVINVPSGTDSAYTTIKAAAGETVWVRPTTFNNLPTSTNQYIINFASGTAHHIEINRIHLDGSGYPQDGIHSVGGISTTGPGGSISSPTHHLIFDGMEIKETRGNTVRWLNNTDSVMRNTHHHHTNSSVADSSGAGCIYFQENTSAQNGGIIEDSIFEYCNMGVNVARRHNWIIRNNVFRNMGFGNNETEGAGIGMKFDPTNGLIYNNIMFNLKTVGVTYNDADAIVNVKVYNNTIYKTLHSTWGHCIRRQGAVTLFSGEASLVKNNICWDLANTGLQVAGNLYSNPSFVNGTTLPYDLKLNSGSPGRNTGLDLSSDVPDDFEGTSRCQGAGCDYGAYEQN